jgi:hypothetical protein
VAVWITVSERAAFPVSDERRFITNQQRSLWMWSDSANELSQCVLKFLISRLINHDS